MIGLVEFLREMDLKAYDEYGVPMSVTTVLRRCEALVDSGRPLRRTSDDDVASIFFSKGGDEPTCREARGRLAKLRGLRKNETLRGVSVALRDCTINIHPPRVEAERQNESQGLIEAMASVSAVRKNRERAPRTWSRVESETFSIYQGEMAGIEMIGGEAGWIKLQRLAGALGLLPLRHIAESDHLDLVYSGSERHALAQLSRNRISSSHDGNGGLAQQLVEALVATFAPMVAKGALGYVQGIDAIPIAVPKSATLRANLLSKRRALVAELRDHLAAERADPRLVEVVAICVDLPIDTLPEDWTGPA